MLGWSPDRNRRRRAIFFFNRKRKGLLRTPLERPIRERLVASAPLAARLPAELRPRHEGVVQVLLHEKRFEGAGGLEVTEGMRLAVAGQAALLQLMPDARFYPALDSIVIYPEPFVTNHEHWDEHGLVHEDEDELSGESWAQGAVVLAWSDVERESRERDGYNVVLHEFAHQLDDETGEADGTPLLADGEQARRWHEAFQRAFEKHGRDLDRDRQVLFDNNAAESPAEFFATAVELFFEHPRDLRREFGAVYACLQEHFVVDPAAFA